MFETEFHIASLIKLLQNGEINFEQRKELDHWITLHSSNRRLFKELMREETLQAKFSDFAKVDEQVGWTKVRQQTLFRAGSSVNAGRRTLWIQLTAAAAVLFVLSFAFYFFAHQPLQEQLDVITQINKVTSPGTERAVLILADGRKVVLTAGGQNNILADANTIIDSKVGGSLEYRIARPGSVAPSTAFNTLVTPAGGTFSLTLSDGTKVRLDASSSIRYPVYFNGTERLVTVQGQAYFEVTPNKSVPFRVKSKGQTVEVLGTHFNINAFSSERMTTTTLIEGKVKVMMDMKSVVLNPGQQSRIFDQHSAIDVRQADIELAVAWTEGYFKFSRADLPTVMKEFSRWYNMDVVYEGTFPKLAVTGRVKRSEEAGHVLEILSGLGVKFRREGRKIIVEEK